MSPSPSDRDAAPGILARWRAHVLFLPLVTLAVLVLLNGAFNPAFFALKWHDGHLYGPVVDILNRAAPLMTVALGMTLVIAVRGIDVSVGATVAIAAAVAATLIGGSLVIQDGHQVFVSRTSLPVAILGALGVAALCGLWNGLLVAGAGIQPIIATLILMVAGRGIAQLITNGQIITIYYQPYFFIGNGYLLGLPFALYIVTLLGLAMALLKYRTALGLFVQASGANPVAARLAGVNATALLVGVYAFCGVMAGIAGLMISSNVKSADANNAGQMLELDAILAVALGGTSMAGGRFTLRGSAIGALVIQTLTYLIYSMGVPPEVNLVVKAIVVFVVCLIQSPAIRGRLRTAAAT